MASYSVVICTYNGQKTLERAIDAILALNLYETNVRELLIVDNASTDATKTIIEKYAAKDQKVKYVYEGKPGLANARRRATEASGDWVIYVDDDNVLDQHWLERMETIINSNDRVGVINGAVIAIPLEELTIEEECRLSLMYRNLACTHIQSLEYPAEQNLSPVGAGMCIPTHILREISDEGWLDLLGRTGEKLASGEDVELCNKVFRKGYTYVCDYRMHMQHLIPKGRLSREYVDKLLRGLIKSRYQLISMRKHYIFERLARTVKYIMLYIAALIPAKDALSAEKKHQNMVVSKAFIRCVLNDKLFLKRTVGEE